jgi:hypothetical protein
LFQIQLWQICHIFNAIPTGVYIRRTYDVGKLQHKRVIVVTNTSAGNERSDPDRGSMTIIYMGIEYHD